MLLEREWSLPVSWTDRLLYSKPTSCDHQNNRATQC